MHSFNHAASGFVLASAIAALAGCGGNNIALVGREPLTAWASQPVLSEIVGTVERLDTRFNEIYLRPNPAHPGMVTYSAETRVIYLGRVYPVSQLQSGDIIAMRMAMDARGNPHTHAIELQASSRDWAQSRN